MAVDFLQAGVAKTDDRTDGGWGEGRVRLVLPVSRPVPSSSTACLGRIQVSRTGRWNSSGRATLYRILARERPVAGSQGLWSVWNRDRTLPSLRSWRVTVTRYLSHQGHPALGGGHPGALTAEISCAPDARTGDLR